MSVAEAVKATRWPALRAFAAGWIEDAAVIACGFLATLHAEWRIIANPLVFQQDAKIHEFWMRRFQDSALLDDPLTNALLETGYMPPGFRSLYWLASHVVDPVFFGELLPLLLQPLSVWLVFRIVRELTPWRPAAWIGAALFLVPWDILRFSGGHARAFAYPILLLTVFLLLRKKTVAAAAVPPVGFLFYPPAGLTALVIVALAALDPGRRFRPDARRLAWCGLSAAALAAAALIPPAVTGASQELISVAQAHRYPEFGPGGRMHFFASSTLAYLKNNYSGFALRDSGSILAVAALLLLVLRPRNARLLRWEVWCMPIAALGLFAAAHAFKFHLYLPHRYTYALLPFFCIAVAVTARPSFEALAARSRGALVLAPALSLVVILLALVFFPLGPQLSLSSSASWLEDAAPYLAAGLVVGLLVAAVAWRRADGRDATRAATAAAVIVAGGVLVAGVTSAGGAESRADRCRDATLYRELRTLPKDAIIAGDPVDLDCIPIAARRPVVISRKLYQPWDANYLPLIRERMFSTVDALYGSSSAAIVDLRTRYGADYLVVRTPPRERAWRGMAPFTGEMRRLLRSVDTPASLRLPDECLTWESRRFEVYSLACVAGERLR